MILDWKRLEEPCSGWDDAVANIVRIRTRDGWMESKNASSELCPLRRQPRFKNLSLSDCPRCFRPRRRVRERSPPPDCARNFLPISGDARSRPEARCRSTGSRWPGRWRWRWSASAAGNDSGTPGKCSFLRSGTFSRRTTCFGTRRGWVSCWSSNPEKVPKLFWKLLWPAKNLFYSHTVHLY